MDGVMCCAIISLFILPTIYGACRLINLLIVAVVCSIIARPNCEFFLVMIFFVEANRIGSLESSLMDWEIFGTYDCCERLYDIFMCGLLPKFYTETSKCLTPHEANFLPGVLSSHMECTMIVIFYYLQVTFLMLFLLWSSSSSHVEAIFSLLISITTFSAILAQLLCFFI